MVNNDLKSKVAIVTGAGHGIGAAVALALGAAGARVAVNDINPDQVEKTAVQIKEAGGQALGITADVANKFQCVNLVETTRAEWGQIDILINNAAVRPSATILKMDEWSWQRTIDVTLKGVFLMSQLVGRVMADENQERGGVIINVGTSPATVPVNQAAYLAAKAGIVGFTEACSHEFADHNIRVKIILPDFPSGQELTPESADKFVAQVLYLTSNN